SAENQNLFTSFTEINYLKIYRILRTYKKQYNGNRNSKIF
ncbi:MAG: hypothetical protein JWQ63_4448, partial [Mucilaginibacter sp.]|nr:hypothetical protein [Mucilaginibacter sp.]